MGGNKEKVVKFDKNFNGKIGNEFFVHVMKPAKQKLTPAQFEEKTVFKVGELEKAYQLFDYKPAEIRHIPAHLFMASYGAISRPEFHREMLERYELRETQEAGIYFFIALDETKKGTAT